MNRKSDPKRIAEKVMDKLVEILADYNHVYDTITHQKPMQTLDYDELLEQLDSAITGVKIIEKVIVSEKIEIPDFEPFVNAIKNAAQAYKPMVMGLSDKANRTGKYGWFAYRKDLKHHDEARRLLTYRSQAFSNNIEHSPEKPEFIEATAHILDPLSDDVLVEKLEIPEDDYNKFKDKNGIVYAMRSYDNGEPSTVLLERKIWNSMQSVFVVTPEQKKQQQDSVKQLMEEMLNNDRKE